MNFNKSVVFKNIYYLAQEKSIKISDLEEAAHVSKGYIARTSKESNTSIPSIDFIVAVASALDVSVDYLITVDTGSLDANEQYISTFLDTIEKNTATGGVNWERDAFEAFTGSDKSLIFTHPLFEDVEVASESSTITYRRYVSYFHAKGVCDLRGDVVKARFLSGGFGHDEIAGSYIYIAPTEYSMMYEDEEQIDHEYEVYLVELDSEGRTSQKIPLCCTGLIDHSVGEQIEAIYKLGLEHSKGTQIDKKAKSMIERYMELNSIPF